jgi:hypothetical protein
LALKRRCSNGFKAKKAYSDKPNPREKQALTKVKLKRKMMTKSHKSKVSQEIISANSDIDSSK